MERRQRIPLGAGQERLGAQVKPMSDALAVDADKARAAEAAVSEVVSNMLVGHGQHGCSRDYGAGAAGGGRINDSNRRDILGDGAGGGSGGADRFGLR
jgi:hypothetical protein